MVALGGATLPAVGASASGPQVATQDFSAGGALGYGDAMKLSAIHEAGITGKAVTIAVFDGGLYPEVASLQGADIDVRELEQCPDPTTPAPAEFDSLQHGTSTTSLIVGNGTSDNGSGPIGIAPDVKILYYGVLQAACDGDVFPSALDDAVAQGADIVSMSGGSRRLADELSQPAADAVKAALRAGVLIVTSLPNADSAWENELGAINGVVNVASVDATAHVAKERDGSDMANADVDVVAPGVDIAGLGWDNSWGMSMWSGNSAATPIVAGLLALAKEKWPDATSSQLLQSLIRNTGSTPRELQWSNTYGHGTVNATRLIEEDPSQYPEENPLFTDGQVPAFDEVYGEPSPAPKAGADEPDSLAAALPWVAGATAFVLIGVPVLVVVSRRRSTAGASSPR